MILRDALLALVVATGLVLAFHIVVATLALLPVPDAEASSPLEPCEQCACWGSSCPNED
jgi:hypothetical protein